MNYDTTIVIIFSVIGVFIFILCGAIICYFVVNERQCLKEAFPVLSSHPSNASGV